MDCSKKREYAELEYSGDSTAKMMHRKCRKKPFEFQSLSRDWEQVNTLLEPIVMDPIYDGIILHDEDVATQPNTQPHMLMYANSLHMMQHTGVLKVKFLSMSFFNEHF